MSGVATANAAQNSPPQQQAAKTSSSSRSKRDKDDTANPDVNLPSIGNYVFIKTCGEGNFAKVKLAKHKITGTEVRVVFWSFYIIFHHFICLSFIMMSIFSLK